MKSYIQESVSVFDTLKTAVFTGGECFTLKKDLEEIIYFSSKLGLTTRVVTNAYWANTPEKALRMLANLQKKGLNEINISTGYEHQKWVKHDNIINGILAAAKLGMTIAINVESHVNHPESFSKTIIEDNRISEIVSTQNIIIKDSLWIDFTEKENTEINSYSKQLNDSACKNLFNTISIDSKSDMYACCGLTCTRNRFLKLGNLKNSSVERLFYAQFDDLLKLWLYTDGPGTIYSFICSKKQIENDSYKYPHLCTLCNKIFSDETNLKIVKENIKDILPNVLLKIDLENIMINNYQH